MNRVAQQPDDNETTDERVLSSLFAHKLRLSLRVIASAQALAWNDLPHNEKQSYMRQAEAAYRAEMKS